MPVTKMLVDSVAGFNYLSMLDGYYGYNQIFITDKYVPKKAFRCPKALGTYEWMMVPFGLKNVGATYQRIMNSIFHDYIETFMQIYIDDIVIKSVPGSGHLYHLRQSFERMRKYGLEMNPLKWGFYAQAEDFLGFVFPKKGIEINQNKTKDIMKTRIPSNKKEIQSLLGKINFLRRFISNLSGKTRAFSPLLRLKKEEFKWQQEHQKFFDEIKEYLMHHPILSLTVKNKCMIVYFCLRLDHKKHVSTRGR